MGRLLLLAGLACLLAARPAADAVYAISDVYSVLPDGSVGEMSKGDLGELRQRNGHFDASTRTIRLFGAQNEEVAVQIVIPFSGEGFSARSGPIGDVPADRVTFSLIAYAKVGTRLVPDVIVPLDGSVAGIKSFSVPLRMRGLPEADNRQGLILFEVWIPKTARPGLHQGPVTILQGGQEMAKLNVDLTVFPFAIPDAPTYRLDYLSYGSPLGSLQLDAALPSGGEQDFKTAPAGLQAEHQAYRLTLENRGFLNILPYKSQRGNALYAYPVKGTGRNAKVVSFEGFDARFGPVLDGKTSKYGRPPACFTLAFNINYPFTMHEDPKRQFDFRPFKNSIPEGPGKHPDLKIFEETYREVAQQTIAHFAEKGWTKTAFEVFFNQKPQDNNRTPWKLDEPVEAADYKGLRYLYNVTKWAFEGAEAKGIRVLTRIDIGHWECEGFRTLEGKPTACYKKKDYNSHQAEAILKPVVDRWVAGRVHVAAAQALVPRYNTAQALFDEYGGSGNHATHFGHFAGVAWRSFFMGVEGTVFYKASFLAPTDVTDDCMLYSAKGLGHDGILASRRIKILRNSANVYDYLVLARQKSAPAIDDLLKRLVKVGPAADPKYRAESKTIETYFTNNVEDILLARRAAAAIIAGKEAGATLEGFSSRYSPNGAADGIVGYD